MPSSQGDPPRFTRVDWAAESAGLRRPRTRTVGLVVAALLLFAFLTYDLVVAPEELVAELHWDVSRMDWLSLAALVVFGRYVVLPLGVNRSRTAAQARRFLSRPAGALSLLLLVLLTIFALLGPPLLDQGYPRLADRLQPPAFSGVQVADLGMYYECAGQMVDGACQGTWKYPLGTTRIGEDLVLLLARGTRIALAIGFATAIVMGLVATVVGTTAGYFGGWVDDVLMGYVDVQQTIPAIVVYIILSMLFLGRMAGTTEGGLFALALVFGLLDWGGIARIVRSEVMARRSAGYINAAKAAGASDLHVIRRHVIPNSTGTIVTALTRRIPLLILAQTGLAYLGLNRAGSKSLGRVLTIGLDGNHMVWHRKWWISAFAVITLVLIVLAFTVFGDEVREVVDPVEEVK